MDTQEIKDRINTNPSELTIQYALKLLERIKIFTSNETVSNDLEKFALLKTASMDICFSCELLLKTRVNDYNNGNDFSTWNTHNLLDIFNKLNVSDQEFVANELNMSVSDIISILSSPETSNAFIKRYLYENNTGIPNYDFLCKFSNSLLKLNNQSVSFEFDSIDTLNNGFDVSQFSFEDIIKCHSNMIYNKSQIFDVEGNDIENYIIGNMKSCDYAFFSELRYKYFDRNQQPKKVHEFSQLHKRLSEACQFLVCKSRYMDRYMSEYDTLDFKWALESLMFTEEFKAGNTVNQLYEDLNTTFEKSRFCTTEYYYNYYNAHDFLKTIKSITDLLMMHPDKANKIYSNKRKVIDNFGVDFLYTMEFNVNEMENLDIDYLISLKSLNSIDIIYIPKELLLTDDIKIRNKLFYFMITMHHKVPPLNIDYIVTELNGEYHIDLDKYKADIGLSELYLLRSVDNIDKYCVLVKDNFPNDLIDYILRRKIDINESKNKYSELLSILNNLTNNNNIKNEFIELYSIYCFNNNSKEEITKLFILYNYFYKDKEVFEYRYMRNMFSLQDLTDLSFDGIINTYSIFKLYNLENLFFEQALNVYDLPDNELKNKLKVISENEEVLSYYFNDKKLFDIDIDELVSLIKDNNIDFRFNLNDFESGEINDLISLLRLKNSLYLVDSANVDLLIKNKDKLERILNYGFFSNSRSLDEKDKYGINILIREILDNNSFENILLESFNVDIVKDHPKVLAIFNHRFGLLENCYRLNVYNVWYNKFKHLPVVTDGGNVNLNSNDRANIINIFINYISDPYFENGYEELSSRLEKIFSNSQLIKSMTKEIFYKYDYNFMIDTIKESKFKTKDFNDINYYGNLFGLIDEHALSKDKVVNLFNILYNHRDKSEVKTFIKKLLECGRTDGVFDISIKVNGVDRLLDDSLIDEVIIELNGKDSTQVISYINNITIDVKEQSTLVPEEEVSISFSDKLRVGREILISTQNILSGRVKKISSLLYDRIGARYLMNKIKIYQLNKMYEQASIKRDEDNERKR